MPFTNGEDQVGVKPGNAHRTVGGRVSERVDRANTPARRRWTVDRGAPGDADARIEDSRAVCRFDADEVRRSEWNELRRTGGAGAAKALKGLRFVLVRNWANLTGKQKHVIRQLEGVNRRLLRAWQLKEELREIMVMPLFVAQRALDDWLAYASRSRLAPFVKLARTIRTYRASIEATIEWKLTNGISESSNASIGRIRANARGFHDPEAFIKVIMLDRAGLAPNLPWTTT